MLASLKSTTNLLHMPLRGDADTDSEPDSDVESHLANNMHLPDLPSRPSSRLGFNSTPKTPSHRESESGKANNAEGINVPLKRDSRWTRGFPPKVNVQIKAPTFSSAPDSEEDEKISNEDMLILSSPLESTETSDDVDMDMDMDLDELSSDSATDDSDSSDSEDSDEARITRLSMRASTPEPESIPTPFPIIPDPLPLPETTISPIPPLTLKRDYSCLPSPLSPHYLPSAREASAPSLPIRNPLRHLYVHHGHSKHSLQHMRSFWSSRREEWTECASERLFGDMQSMTMRSDIRLPVWPAGSLASQIPSQITIHPRTGDLTKLKDTQCAHTDMYLASIPMWTMGKLCWMAGISAMQARNNKTENVVASSTICDDSDTMLVDVVSPPTQEPKDIPRVDSSIAVEMASSILSGVIQSTWPISASARWELLLQYARVNSRPPQPPTTKPRFFLGDDDDDTDADEWVDARGRYMEIDDEDDYGVLVANPVFGRVSMYDSAICV